MEALAWSLSARSRRPAYANCSFGYISHAYVQYSYGHGFYIRNAENRIEERFAYRCGTATDLASGFCVEGSHMWVTNCISGGVDHQITACEGQDAANAAFSITSAHSTFNISCDISGGTHIVVRESDNVINANTGDGASHGATPTLVNIWSASMRRNRIKTNFNNPVSNGGSDNGVTAGIAGGGALTAYNEIITGSPQALWTATYAATLTLARSGKAWTSRSPGTRPSPTPPPTARDTAWSPASHLPRRQPGVGNRPGKRLPRGICSQRGARQGQPLDLPVRKSQMGPGRGYVAY